MKLLEIVYVWSVSDIIALVILGIAVAFFIGIALHAKYVRWRDTRYGE